MPKLSRSQIKEARSQAKKAREKAQQEQLQSDDHIEQTEAKRDYKGLTSDQRKEIRDIKSKSEQSGPKITWNYENGDLVYLPDMSIGMIVQNEAKDLPANYFETDMKKTIKMNKYNGKVFVVTTSGNQWYYPNQLKKVNEQ
mgnify:CR=1 FL=1